MSLPVGIDHLLSSSLGGSPGDRSSWKRMRLLLIFFWAHLHLGHFLTLRHVSREAPSPVSQDCAEQSQAWDSWKERVTKAQRALSKRAQHTSKDSGGSWKQKAKPHSLRDLVDIHFNHGFIGLRFILGESQKSFLLLLFLFFFLQVEEVFRLLYS